MNFPVIYTLLMLFAWYSEGKPAQPLLSFNSETEIFELNEDLLLEIAELQQPIRVIAVIGDARIGKSTTLNLINHIWSGANQTYIEEVFKTGDTLLPVTRDVWAQVIQPRDEQGGNVVLLDVEGTNLGDDALTTHLSMFTALISSGLNLFVREMVQNNNLHFLFHMSRLSDLVFPNISLENFPKLQVVIRQGSLKDPGEGKTIEDYTRDSIVGASSQKNMKEERRIIAKHFPRNQISVIKIPYLQERERDLLSDFEKLSKLQYWGVMERLVEKLKQFPVKKTLRGSYIDGQALVELTGRLIETMNKNSWPDFGSVYDTIEKNICSRSYIKFVEPLFAELTADTIEAKLEDTLRAFEMECVLENEIAAARSDLQRIVEEKRKDEELERKAKEAESERLAAEKRREEQEHELAIKEDQIAKVKREKEEAQLKEKNFKQLLEEQLKTIAMLQEQLRRKKSGWLGAIVPVIAGFAGAALLSDRDLKRNITTISHSPYSVIKLEGACWEWNEIAEKTFGLIGEECGVIAQEAKKLYSFAVTRGKDGYLMVRYDLLHEIMDSYLQSTSQERQSRINKPGKLLF